MSRARPLSLNAVLADLLARGPTMHEAFRRAGLAGCLGCAMAAFDTLGDAIAHFGLDARNVLRELGPAFTESEPCPRPTKSARRSRKSSTPSSG